MENFIKLGLSPSSIEAIKAKGFEEPTEIQKKTIPLLLKSNKDIVAQAQTGTGKTGAFALPLIEKLDTGNISPQAIVLAPTRELALQVSEEINSLKGGKNLKVVPIYGGQQMPPQIKALKAGCDIVIGTPGRVLDHLNRGSLKLDKIKYAVLDEADEMLNMGFMEDVQTILEQTSSNRQLLLFSATMPKKILELAKNYMSDFDIVEVKKDQLTNNLVDQIYFEVYERDKVEAVSRIIDIEEEFYGIIFCRTRVETDEVAKRLRDINYAAEAIHGDIAQGQREKILDNFKAKKTMILVATDVAARGIDVNNLTHVINYSLPQDPESYVHRIGRTGRAGKQGIAITFITPDEYGKLSFISRISKSTIRKEKVPDPKDIVQKKKTKLVSELNKIIKDEDLSYYSKILERNFNEFDKDQLISALLKYSFSKQLELENYAEIRDVSSNKKTTPVDFSGKTRLFITVGKKDDINVQSLLKLIEQEANIDQKFISDIDIFDTYSFISVPFQEAEIILHKLHNIKRGSMRIKVEKSSAKKSSSSSSNRSGRSSSGRSSFERSPSGRSSSERSSSGRSSSGRSSSERSSSGRSSSERSSSERSSSGRSSSERSSPGRSSGGSNNSRSGGSRSSSRGFSSDRRK